MRSGVVLRDKTVAGKGQQTENKGDEKANTGTHFMQFSAIGASDARILRLMNIR